MGNIRVLPEQVATRIAAGEVILRPASVVKELVENSLDAGSTTISIEVKGSGKTFIQVGDNGTGMDRDDALLAFERFATSKIAEENDLERIETLGFRGEALPSISAVSQVELITKTEDSLWGTKLLVEGGEVVSVKDIGCPRGTVVRVSNLFYNTPARRKFLKSASTELGHILKVVTWNALVHPEVSFQLVHSGSKLLQVPSCRDCLERINLLLGEMEGSLLSLDLKSPLLEVSGYVGKPVLHRSSGNFLYFFINRRPIRSRLLVHAVMDAYHTLLPSGRFPVVFLFLTMDPSLVDVNVHPAKEEVRFRREKEVHDLVSNLVRGVLKKVTVLPPLEISPQEEEGRALRVKEAMGKYLSRKIGRQEVRGQKEKFLYPLPHYEEEKEGKFLQVHNTYILGGTEEGIFFIDQHAAHERILYEQLMDSFKNSSWKLQQLLLPVNVELDYQGAVFLSEKLSLLRELGLEVEKFGKNAFLIRSFPQILERANPGDVLRDVVEELKEEKGGKKVEELRERILTLMACRGAVKAGDKLEPEEISSLVTRLSKCELPHTCPHGRPTIVKISYGELEKKFGRK